MTTPDRPLFSRWPALRDSRPIVELATLPTPVEAAPALAAELGCASLSIKRDDLTAADYGGNKIRKLEFLLGDARRQGRTEVITFGGLGSNHCIATALNCRRLGMGCTVILTAEPLTPQVKTALGRHLELGSRIRVASSYADVRRLADEALTEFGAEHCYEVPFGGSSAVGSLGYVNAALELAAQIEAGTATPPAVIYAACGTAGTVAGLALGLQLAGLDARIEALQVTPESMQLEALAARLIAELSRDFGADADPEEAFARLNIRRDQLGDGYAMPTPAGREASALWQQLTGLPMSLTYTAKALAGLLHDGRAGKLERSDVMFINTYNSHAYAPPTEPDWNALPAGLGDALAGL